MTTIEVTPAYGRDYKSQAEVRTDWENDLDFQIAGSGRVGPYLNKQDAEQGNLKVLVRYAKLTKVVAIN